MNTEEKLDVALGALRDIYGLHETYEPILNALCPPGTIPTPGQEKMSTTLAQPFIIAREAITLIEAER